LIAALWIINLFALLKRWKKPTLIQWLFFMLCLFLPAYLQGILVELLLMISLVRNYLTEQEEAAKQRTHIAVLQMRPHFIHNTLMSIYYLCAQNPEKAQTVIKDFSRYLQSNFTAIAKEGMIPFAEELEHTRAYLAVEQAQFEDSLFVDYDTEYTKFLVPPLTLQPIVENAVKHGMDPDSDPLHITIRTLRIGSGSEIIVEDNGSGFDQSDKAGSNDPHIALSNIEQRLKMMCRGEITITPREGGGTVVMVTIP
jgi:LytS/YehU family sensor histidine kinase